MDNKKDIERPKQFKPGDVITHKQFYQGFENLTVMGVVKRKGAKGVTRECYVCKIPHGEVFLPVSAEPNYELVKTKRND